jgi:hypothetical protein
VQVPIRIGPDRFFLGNDSVGMARPIFRRRRPGNTNDPGAPAFEVLEMDDGVRIDGRQDLLPFAAADTPTSPVKAGHVC